MAIQVYNHLSVDLVFDSTIPTIDVVQGDTARGLIVTYLTEIEGLDDSNVSAVLKVRRADGEEGWAQGTVEKLGADMAQVIVDPSDDYTALIDCAGIADAILEVYSGSDVISTFRFRIDVKENPFYGTTIGSLTPRQLEAVEDTAYQSAQDWMDDHPEASTTVEDGAITTAKLADNSVTSAKIVDGAITSDDLADGSVATSKLADTSVTAAKLASNAVTTAKITNANVTRAKLADDAAMNPTLLYEGNPTIATSVTVSGYRFLILNACATSPDMRAVATTIIFRELAVTGVDNVTKYGDGDEYEAHLILSADRSTCTVRVTENQYGGLQLYGIK